MSSNRDFLKEVIDNIDKIRKKNGMNAKEFAQKLGKRSGILTDWRTGRSSPSLDAIFHVCELFNCTFYDIFPSNSFSSAHSNNIENEFSYNDENTIGTRIKNRRQELNLTQAQIKEFTGISSGNLSGMENGKFLPSAAALLELSKILNCSTDWLLTGKPQTSGNNSLTCETAYEYQLLRFYREMDVIDQEDLLLIAEMKYNKKKTYKSKLSDSSETERPM